MTLRSGHTWDIRKREGDHIGIAFFSAAVSASQLVDAILKASVEAFKEIAIEEMAAFAIGKDTRGFQSFALGPGEDSGETVPEFSRSHKFLEYSLHCERTPSFLPSSASFVQAAEKSQTTALLYRVLREELKAHGLSKEWEIDDPDSNPVYQKTLAPVRMMYEKHQPVKFMDRLPLLSRRLSRTGKLSSRFPVYDIVGEILYGEIPLIVKEKWVPWIEESLRGGADQGRRLELWTEISFDFVDICATYPAILESVSYLGRVWHKNPNPVAFAHDLGT
ncbi:hypothetical protein B0J12DRAFT_705324 [Macrophomina phaseolina]|uniref:Uncharacterized protein n=1 Tax=Macrophomina phaseolina TaxID=35725 RepID=A0ABQ8FSE8_9PEZI|nr:hypothetical protein B0J12DRAFT_705324 [Macrophomina phaseolina]